MISLALVNIVCCSDKFLPSLLQLLERLYNKQWTQLDGLGALVITPTRELAYQIFEVLNKVGKEHDFSAGLVIGESLVPSLCVSLSCIISLLFPVIRQRRKSVLIINCAVYT